MLSVLRRKSYAMIKSEFVNKMVNSIFRVVVLAKGKQKRAVRAERICNELNFWSVEHLTAYSGNQ